MQKIIEILMRWRSSFYGIPPAVWQKHIFLAVATFISMTITYFNFSFETSFTDKITGALTYSIVLVFILLSHELGHFIHAREYGVETTLPYFIPLPFLSPFGTLGAYIRMKTLPPDRRALFDISFWGPAMSFFMSLPAIAVGLLMSQKVPLSLLEPGLIVGTNELVFGSSILFQFMTNLLVDIPDGYTLVLHPVAFAGWIGVFVTAINLFPIGQLDGGHIAYVFLGKRQLYIAYVFLGILIFLALYVSSGWVFWIFMLIFMGLKHPPIRTVDTAKKIDNRRIFQGILSALIFILCFIPEPLKINPVRKPPVRHERQNMQKNFEFFHDIHYTIPVAGYKDHYSGESGWR